MIRFFLLFLALWPAAAGAQPAPPGDTDSLTPAVQPDTDAPDTDAPDTDAPDTDAPDTDAPDTDAPPADAPVDVPYVWMGPPLPSMWLAAPVVDEAGHGTDAPDPDAHDRDTDHAAAVDTDHADTDHTDHTDTDHTDTDHSDTDHSDTDTDTDHADGASGDPDDPAPSAIEPADAATPWLDRVLPELRLRGVQWAFLLALFTLLAWGAARALDPVRERLAHTGLLPALTIGAQQLLRLLVLFFGLGVVAAIVPADVAPALPFVVLAGAIAIGWSARDVMPDLLAGMVISAERRIRPDQWISTPRAAGVVEQVALRVTWIRDATGRRVAVPNRMLLQDPVIMDRGRWPTVELVVRVPEGHAPSAVRRIVEDAILVSPWAAPVGAEMVNEEAEPGRWRVRARVLEGRFADRFEGALREHVEEVLTKGTRLWE